jgi:hypothetical protein
MRLDEIAKALDFMIINGDKEKEIDFSGVYICDLMSMVMANAKKDQVWITIHTHINVIAVALLTEVAFVLIPENINVEEMSISKAKEEGIVILSTPLTSYEAAVKINEFLKKQS